MRAYLTDNKILSASDIDTIDSESVDEIKEAVRYASEDCTEPSVDGLYDNLFADGEIIK